VKPPAKVWHDVTLHMGVQIDGIWHQSRPAVLKVKNPNAKDEPKKDKKTSP
jgi:hypothetical protein